MSGGGPGSRMRACPGYVVGLGATHAQFLSDDAGSRAFGLERGLCAYSAARLDPVALFDGVLREALAALPSSRRVWLAMDDSTLRKSGRTIPLTGWRRDPLSPPFAVNFQWGHRVLQTSL